MYFNVEAEIPSHLSSHLSTLTYTSATMFASSLGVTFLEFRSWHKTRGRRKNKLHQMFTVPQRGIRKGGYRKQHMFKQLKVTLKLWLHLSLVGSPTVIVGWGIHRGYRLSLYANLCLAILQQKLLSSPWFGALRAIEAQPNVVQTIEPSDLPFRIPLLGTVDTKRCAKMRRTWNGQKYQVVNNSRAYVKRRTIDMGIRLQLHQLQFQPNPWYFKQYLARGVKFMWLFEMQVCLSKLIIVGEIVVKSPYTVGGKYVA